jgi:hypothetical protein
MSNDSWSKRNTGATSLNDGLAEHCYTSANNGNRAGVTNKPLARVHADLKLLLKGIAREASSIPGRERMTKLESIAREVFNQAEHGERWAINFLALRMFGRVPYAVQVEQHQTHELSGLSSAELRERFESALSRVRDQRSIDAQATEVIDDDTTRH